MMNESHTDEIFDDELLNGTQEVPFDKEKWIEEKVKEKEEAFELIDFITSKVSNDDTELIGYIDLSAHFPTLSAVNSLLIFGQDRDATDIRSYDDWKKIDVHVKKGERGMMLLERSSEYIRMDETIGYNYKTKTVFDISQTTAEVKEKDKIDHLSIAKAVIASSPVAVVLKEDIESNNKCFYDPEQNVIYIAKIKDPKDVLAHLLPEIAHARLRYKKESYNRAEYEGMARCVNYLLSKRYDLNAELHTSDRLDIFYGCDTLVSKREALNEIVRTANAITRGIDKIREQKQNVKEGR